MLDLVFIKIQKKDGVIFLFAILYFIEASLFGLKALSNREFGKSYVATELSTSLFLGTMFLLHAFILQNSSQFALYPIIYGFNLAIVWIHPTFKSNTAYELFKITKTVLTSIRGLLIVFMWKSFRNIFHWKNFLKYKSNEHLIGK